MIFAVWRLAWYRKCAGAGMSRVTQFERQMIEMALAPAAPDIPPDRALALIPNTTDALTVFKVAISPAFHDVGFRITCSGTTFDVHCWLSDVAAWARGAQVIVADVTGLNSDVMYVLGLCHGLGRCPILISQEPRDLPFHLDALRCLEYSTMEDGLHELRERLARLLRVYLR